MQHPSTWVVLSDKLGDNGQVEAIASALPWPCERKQVLMLDRFVKGKPRFRPSLAHIDRRRSDPLEPPWPDLILTMGRRPAMVALWVRRQSGNKTRVVLVGKPTSRMLDFDLIISSAEKHMPPLANYLPITLPLMRVDPALVAAAAEQWRARLEALPRPIVAIMVGGATSPFAMNKQVAEKLLATARWVLEDLGGTPYVSTSRRTASIVVDLLRKGLPEEAEFFEWKADATDNPYRALLGAADGIIVTGDSISMMVETIYLRKPLAIFPLPYAYLGRLDQLRRSFARWLFSPKRESRADTLRHALARAVFRLDYFTLLSSTRDFRYFHQMLVNRGLAVWSGQPFAAASGELPEDISAAVSRIEALFPQGVPARLTST
jgi:mitochondrial fission protein ELM1